MRSRIREQPALPLCRIERLCSRPLWSSLADPQIAHKKTSYGVFQGSASSPAILTTWLMKAVLWEPWGRQGECEGWGVDVDGTRMTWADDNMTVARDARTLRRMWDEATRLIDEAGFTIDSHDVDKCCVWTATGLMWRAEAPRGVEEVKVLGMSYRRNADSAAANARVAAAARALRG